MTRASSGDFDVERLRATIVEGRPAVITKLAANFQIDANFPSMLVLRATVARSVRMPAASTVQDGRIFYIHNGSTGAFAFTLNTSTGGALSPAVTIAQNMGAMMALLGGVWIRLLKGATVAG